MISPLKFNFKIAGASYSLETFVHHYNDRADIESFNVQDENGQVVFVDGALDPVAEENLQVDPEPQAIAAPSSSNIAAEGDETIV